MSSKMFQLEKKVLKVWSFSRIGLEFFVSECNKSVGDGSWHIVEICIIFWQQLYNRLTGTFTRYIYARTHTPNGGGRIIVVSDSLYNLHLVASSSYIKFLLVCAWFITELRCCIPLLCVCLCIFPKNKTNFRCCLSIYRFAVFDDDLIFCVNK